MANPWLRIFLVDEDHSTRMNIEKNLASLGYHRVAPMDRSLNSRQFFNRFNVELHAPCKIG